MRFQTVKIEQIAYPVSYTHLRKINNKTVESRFKKLGSADFCKVYKIEIINFRNKKLNIITSEQWPQKARRPTYSVLDTGRLTRLTGIKPRPWPQALRDYIFQSFAAGTEAH